MKDRHVTHITRERNKKRERDATNDTRQVAKIAKTFVKEKHFTNVTR